MLNLTRNKLNAEYISMYGIKLAMFVDHSLQVMIKPYFGDLTSVHQRYITAESLTD